LHPAGGQMCTVLLVALLPLLASLSSGPALHRLLHPDAQAPAHECVAKVLADGQVLVAGADALPLPPRPSLLWTAPASCRAFVCRVDLRLAPGRAPPVAVSSLVG
jgi:hypothetical protein